MTPQENPYPLRLPVELREAIKRIAEKNHRSVNGEIIAAIERHVKAEESKR